MKQSGKILSVLLALMLIASVLTGAVFAEEGYRTCTVECLTFEVPEDMLVLTQGMAEDDSSLEYLGLTPDEMDEILGTINLLITPKVDNWDVEISVYPRGADSVFTPEVASMSDYSEAELNELVDEWNETNPDDPAEINYLDGYPFLGAVLSGGVDFTVMYISTIGDLEVVIMFYGDGLEPEEDMIYTWADILERITIERVTDTAAESEETAEEPAEEPAEEAAEEAAEEPEAEPEEEPEEEPFVWDTEGSTVYEISDFGMSIEIPNCYLTMTKGMAEDDPILRALGFDAETVDELLESFNRELNVVPTDLSWEFYLSAETDEELEELGDRAVYSEKDFKKSFAGIKNELIDAIDGDLEDYSMKVLDSGTVVLGGYNYYWLDISINSEEATYSRSSVYVTLLDGTQYLFSIAYADDSQREDVEQVAEEFLSKVEYTAAPPVEAMDESADESADSTESEGLLDSLSDGLVTGVIAGAVAGAVVALVGVLIGRAQRKNKQKKAAARAKAAAGSDPWESEWSDTTPWKDEKPAWSPKPEQRSESRRSEYDYSTPGDGRSDSTDYGYSTPGDDRNEPPYMN